MCVGASVSVRESNSPPAAAAAAAVDRDKSSDPECARSQCCAVGRQKIYKYIINTRTRQHARAACKTGGIATIC